MFMGRRVSLDICRLPKLEILASLGTVPFAAVLWFRPSISGLMKISLVVVFADSA